MLCMYFGMVASLSGAHRAWISDLQRQSLNCRQTPSQAVVQLVEAGPQRYSWSRPVIEQSLCQAVSMLFVSTVSEDTLTTP